MIQKKERWNYEKKTCWSFLYVSTQGKLPVRAQGTLALEHVSTQGTLALEHISMQGTLAREHVSMQGTLAREHISTQGTLAREHVSMQGMLAREYVSTQDTLARELVFSTRGTQFSSLPLLSITWVPLWNTFRSTIQPTQAAFTCSKSTMKTSEQHVKSAQN